jgi:hypothetical protein
MLYKYVNNGDNIAKGVIPDEMEKGIDLSHELRILMRYVYDLLLSELSSCFK